MRWVSTQGYFTGQSQSVRKKKVFVKTGWSLIKGTGKQGSAVHYTNTHKLTSLSLSKSKNSRSLSLPPSLSNTPNHTDTKHTHTHSCIHTLEVAAFSSLARSLEEWSILHSTSVLFFFFSVEISLHTLIPLFMPGSVHSSSMS